MTKIKKEVSKETIDRVGGEKNLRRIELPTNELGNENIEVVCCVPDRRTMGQYLKYQSVNPAKAQEILVKNCILTDLEAVLADKAKLAAILTYHVVAGKVMAADVVGMHGKVATTVQGSGLHIDTTHGVKVGTATVTKTDIVCSNGVIHIIDSVLIPS